MQNEHFTIAGSDLTQSLVSISVRLACCVAFRASLSRYVQRFCYSGSSVFLNLLTHSYKSVLQNVQGICCADRTNLKVGPMHH